MYFATIDCGTTNSRVYVVDEHGTVFGKATKKVGVRDTSMTGTNEVLKQGLKETFLQAVEQAGLSLRDIQFAISAGMITSEIGLLEVPHLWAPVGMEDLARHMVRVHDLSVFPVDLPIYFVPGIKNVYDPETVSLHDAGMLDFMRGEEIQIAGLLSHYRPQLPVTAVVLSSHTKFVPVNAQQQILGSLTTLSGQVYAAILKETSIGKSIRKPSEEPEIDYFDAKVVDSAYDRIHEGGFLRAMLMPRFLDVLIQTEWYERELFVEAALAAEDMRTIDMFERLQFPLDTNYILFGAPRRCALYKYLLEEKIHITQQITTITAIEEIDQLHIKGAISLVRKAGLI